MRVGIDGSTWTNERGYGRFTRELVRAMTSLADRHKYVLFLDPAAPSPDLPGAVEVRKLPVKVAPSRAASADGFRSPRDLVAASRAFATTGLDLLFFPSTYTYVPVMARFPIVVCIHDVIAEKYPSFVFKSGRARLFWGIKTRLAVAQASRLVTVSEYARRRVAEHFRLPPEAIAVSGEAPSPAFRPIFDPAAIRSALASVGLEPGSRFLVYVGGLSPHKNLGMLVRVVAGLAAEPRYRDVRLVIVGDYSRDVFYSAYESLRHEVDALPPGTVAFAGYRDDETVARLFASAAALVLPSFEEGFGLPGIEAAACGTAVVATRFSALPEALGDAALYIDPFDAASVDSALRLVLDDECLRRKLGAAALERARGFTWQAAARRVIAVFDDLERASGR